LEQISRLVEVGGPVVLAREEDYPAEILKQSKSIHEASFRSASTLSSFLSSKNHSAFIGDLTSGYIDPAKTLFDIEEDPADAMNFYQEEEEEVPADYPAEEFGHEEEMRDEGSHQVDASLVNQSMERFEKFNLNAGRKGFKSLLGVEATKGEAAKLFVELLYLNGEGKVRLEQDDPYMFSEITVCQ